MSSAARFCVTLSFPSPADGYGEGEATSRYRPPLNTFPVQRKREARTKYADDGLTTRIGGSFITTRHLTAFPCASFAIAKAEVERDRQRVPRHKV